MPAVRYVATNHFKGHETAANVVGNAVVALDHHPDQAAPLCARPDLVDAACDELVRRGGPTKITVRAAAAPVEIDRRHVGPGDRAFLGDSAANRDPTRLADPDRLALARGEGQRVEFRFGIRCCLGAPLAGLEGTTAVPSLLVRSPGPRVDRPPDRRPTPSSRGLEALPVAVG